MKDAYDLPVFEDDTEFRPEFFTNPSARCACVLLLDTSGSMHGPKIDALNNGLRTFMAELRNDPVASLRVELGIITFGPVQVLHDFATPDQITFPHLTASGDTPIGDAIETAVDMVERRKAVYRGQGVQHYRPWVFMLTDGEATDDVKIAKSLIARGEQKKAFSFWAVGVDGANMGALNQLSAKKALSLHGLAFRELFTWLSGSLSAVSAGDPLSDVALANPVHNPDRAPDGWAVA
jgi:uncharacterized protein YegL